MRRICAKECDKAQQVNTEKVFATLMSRTDCGEQVQALQRAWSSGAWIGIIGQARS
jgi:hypothetical protein